MSQRRDLPNIPWALLSRLGVFRLSRAVTARRGRFVLAFHGVADQRYPDVPLNIQPSMTSARLRTVLSWLSARFTFLTPGDFFNGGQPGVLLTFDDGLASNAENALPLLEQFDAPAIFFIATRHVRDPQDWLPGWREFARRQWPTEAAVPAPIARQFWDGMTVSQLERCAAHPLITIGSHTVNHPHLPACDDQQLRAELVDSRRWLESVTGRTVELFAYPYGSLDRRTAEAVRAAGYRAAFGEQPHPVGLPPYQIPRAGIYHADPAYLDGKLSGLHTRPI